MDINELKKALAGLCIATLVSGGGLAFGAASSA
jgi:radical SAM modification target selenobiotic family peptide